MNRVHIYPITNEEKTKELNIWHPRNKKHNNKNTSQQHQTTKWAKKRNTNERCMHRRPQPDIRNNTRRKQQIATHHIIKGGIRPIQQALKNKTYN
jgi:hypothetical protein